MLGVDSTGLRVDIQAANRILSHAGRESFQGTDGRNGKTLKERIGNTRKPGFHERRKHKLKHKRPYFTVKMAKKSTNTNGNSKIFDPCAGAFACVASKYQA